MEQKSEAPVLIFVQFAIPGKPAWFSELYDAPDSNGYLENAVAEIRGADPSWRVQSVIAVRLSRGTSADVTDLLAKTFREMADHLDYAPGPAALDLIKRFYPDWEPEEPNEGSGRDENAEHSTLTREQQL